MRRYTLTRNEEKTKVIAQLKELAGKNGAMSLPTSGAVHYDQTINVHGVDAIHKRSIVVHGPSGTSPRIACATIGGDDSANWDNIATLLLDGNADIKTCAGKAFSAFSME